MSLRGELQLIFGPMFAGKTTELIRRLNRYKVAGRTCLVVNYTSDASRPIDKIMTHDNEYREAIQATRLDDLKSMTDFYNIIGIDDGHFFPDIVSFAEEMTRCGKTVIVAALDGTFQRKPFGHVLELVPLAESVIKLTAVCTVCYDKASFTKRSGTETKVECLGGIETYTPLCRKCYDNMIS